jgi:hypothetical protein
LSFLSDELSLFSDELSDESSLLSSELSEMEDDLSDLLVSEFLLQAVQERQSAEIKIKDNIFFGFIVYPFVYRWNVLFAEFTDISVYRLKANHYGSLYSRINYSASEFFSM